MSRFDFYQPTKIHFGAGRLNELGNLALSYGTRCLLVTTENTGVLKPLFDRVKNLLIENGIEVFHFDGVLPNPTVELVDKGVKTAFENNVDVIVGLGGGSSMDTAKIIGLTGRHGSVDWKKFFSEFSTPFGSFKAPYGEPIPVIAITTTSGTGSQVTQAAVITDTVRKDKATIFHPLCFPRECIVDPELTLSLPRGVTASTGFDAFSHAFEAYINKNSSPYTESLSLNAMSIISSYLPKALNDESNPGYREKLAYADTLAGIALSNTGADIPHPLSEIISGVCPRIAHGQGLAMVYPGYVAYRWPQNPAKFAAVARILDPELESQPDEAAASKTEELLVKFLKEINMRFALANFNPSASEIADIANCPVLGFLPMAPKEALTSIIKSGF